VEVSRASRSRSGGGVNDAMDQNEDHPAAGAAEEDLSDASLVEEDDDELTVPTSEPQDVADASPVAETAEEAEPEPAAEQQPSVRETVAVAALDVEETASSASAGSTIDLPGEPITAPAGSASEETTPQPDMEVEMAEVPDEMPAKDEKEDQKDPPNLSSDPFHGFTVEEAMEAKKLRLDDLAEANDDHVVLLPSTRVKLVQPKLKISIGGQKMAPPARVSAGQAKSRPAAAPQPSPASANAPRRESREWRPSSILFKPLATGWIREVIYKELEGGTYDMTKAPMIVYHAPRRVPGTKHRSFKQMAELAAYINAAEPTFTTYNFSFRAEPMHASAGQEIIRGENEVVEIFPADKEKPAPQPPTAAAKKPQQRRSSQNGKAEIAPGSKPGSLKLKLFSKMNEKTSLRDSGASPLPQAPASNTLPPPRGAHAPSPPHPHVPVATIKPPAKRSLPRSMGPGVSITPVNKASKYASGGAAGGSPVGSPYSWGSPAASPVQNMGSGKHR